MQAREWPRLLYPGTRVPGTRWYDTGYPGRTRQIMIPGVGIPTRIEIFCIQMIRNSYPGRDSYLYFCVTAIPSLCFV
eukprot:1350186-Rhodomonas_salina.1